MSNLKFWVLLFAALTLAPSLAHVLQMGQKMDLGPDSYRIAQVVYRGWAFTGVFLVVAALLSLVYWLQLQRDHRPYGAVAVAFLCYVVSLVDFFLFTYPVNRVTRNWIDLPPNWAQLRIQWEYSHAFAALLELTAFVLLTWKITRVRK